jgi:hypothetical protein
VKYNLASRLANGIGRDSRFFTNWYVVEMSLSPGVLVPSCRRLQALTVSLFRLALHRKAFGRKQVPPNSWIPWFNCNNSRIIDMLDILYASSIRDAECHDPLFSSFLWNVSQNADRESHRSATPGIAGCLTVGGDYFFPHYGRPMLGCERLLAQGIPYFRLMLGTLLNHRAFLERCTWDLLTIARSLR